MRKPKAKRETGHRRPKAEPRRPSELESPVVIDAPKRAGFEIDVAPDLVDEGQSPDRSGRDAVEPICSLPEDSDNGKA